MRTARCTSRRAAALSQDDRAQLLALRGLAAVVTGVALMSWTFIGMGLLLIWAARRLHTEAVQPPGEPNRRFVHITVTVTEIEREACDCGDCDDLPLNDDQDGRY